MHLEVEEAEVLDRPQEPGDVTHHLLPPRQPCRVSEGGRVDQFPHDVLGDQRLPPRVVGEQCLEMSSQEVGGGRHFRSPSSTVSLALAH